ncbi:cardiolipin synthase [Pustulibacterium marinum]|uniref:Cardiolipin synthase n=1 Tax=Pustulibacterium marinum TaxID=1224947 RepID=A0A1I7G4U9_9FLAO|nr:cardiolipin synthase [Pustulibacterium marinum]SFU43474.1 cardiolipin synthase [Pustulibacterium marinum]
MVAYIESLTAIQIILAINYLFVVVALFTVLFKNNNPTKTLSYIIILIVLPFFGLIVYYLFGQEYRKQKIFNRKNVLNQSTIKKYQKALAVDEEELVKLEEELLDGKVKLIKLLNSSEDAPLTRCNEVEIIRNGENTIPRIVEDLEKATSFIHLEYYIIRDDETGNMILDVLCNKAQEGIEVKLIYDYVGSSLSNATMERLSVAGVEFHPFMPVYFPKFTSKLNYRDHRKIAIIDGKIGYVGGVNISNTYFNGRNDMYWRDTHTRIVGQAVGSLQMHFFMTWDFVTEESYEIVNAHFPKCETSNRTALQIAASGPDTDWANIMEAIFTAINIAEDYVYITTPYFIPNDEMITALSAAAKSGVDVKIITPEQSDSWMAKHASASYFERMLESGVRIFYYQPGFVHAKTMVVDDVFTTIGTSNMDYRSFNINFEINALIYDEKISAEALSHFKIDLAESREVVLEEWEKRSFSNKLAESFTRLMAPLL